MAQLEDTDIDIENLTFPNNLADLPLPVFDTRQLPFSPTSPVMKSPGLPRTMKEYEEDFASLKKENFNLKVRIYFLEQERIDPTLPKDLDELRRLYTNLKVEHDLQKKELGSLLTDSYNALEVQKQQLDSVTEEKQELQAKLENLEKELRDYHQRFMETSVPHLDDTNALYTVTFGLNSKPGSTFEEKIRELQEDLSKEKERALRLEQELTLLNEKTTDDGENVQKLMSQLHDMEQNLQKILEERNRFEELYKDASTVTRKLEKSLRKMESKEKITEGEKWKSLAEELRKQLTRVENKLQEKEETESRTDKRLKLVYFENEKLKQEVKYLQHLAEKRTSTSHNSATDEPKEPQLREAELLQELEKLKAQLLQSKSFIQTMYREKKQLKAQVEKMKADVRGHTSTSSKEEANRSVEEVKEKSTEKELVTELQSKVEELAKVITEKDSELKELKAKLDSLPNKSQSTDSNQQSEENCKDNEIHLKELEDKNKEIENLKKELKKKTFNLQGLVNKELWDKNREIEKLNKLCERQHVEMMSLEKQIREYQLTMMEKVSGFTSPVTFQRSIFNDKENQQPMTDTRMQIQRLVEDKRQLQRTVEELQARLLNTPERDKESAQIQALREEKDAAEKQRKEAVNACVLLTTRLQELADFLESLLPLLCGKKRKYVQQAVERSRELSRSLSLAAEESSLLQCSTWTDLQPSLVVPLLPDISTVDFWSGDEAEEPFSGDEAGKAAAETLNTEKNCDNPFLNSIFNFDGKKFSIGSKEDDAFYDLADITEGSLVDTCSEALDNTCTRINPEVKSSNIGKITLTSRKKSVGDTKERSVKEDGSECETWSEPDRDVSYARMGLKEDLVNKTTLACDDTSETAESIPKSPLSRRGSEIQRLQRKIRNLEQVNAALRSELVILHQLTPPALTRQDKATSIELSRRSSFSVPAHLLDEIRNQREKLEASLFHNDYIRRQLETTVSSLQRSQGEQDSSLLGKLKEVTLQLETAENEASELKKERQNLNTKVEFLHSSLQKTSDELRLKQKDFERFESETTRELNEITEKYSKKLSDSEQKCLELENKSVELEKQNVELTRAIEQLNGQIVALTREIEDHVVEGKKNKELVDELNVKLQQLNRQRDELQRLTAEQEQLLADAERERQELATQLIARDREVSELSKRMSNVELTSSELEAALRSQLELATQQCVQFENRVRDLDGTNKKREAVVADLQRRLDAARFAHSEAVLQYTRVANDNIRLQQELRNKQYSTADNQMVQVERMKAELERRVAELEAVNIELEGKLGSLNIVRHPMSDYETDAGSSVVGSPRRTIPSPPRPAPGTSPARSHDLTSDYLSDQEPALSSPQSQVRGLWYPVSPHSHPSTSPDLGIESDHGRFSSLETHKTTTVSIRGTPVKDLMKLEEENTQLRLNLQKTRHALEETLAQLTAANQHKRQYEAQLSAANQHKVKVERAICRQLHKTHSILKKARVNLEEDGKSDRC
ncbi:centrosomin-like isoform X2 [Macrosteles quadrilineatus]|uniref:centrosomin-like isoform X2 n=1 Tax=Macrosteles quadrilineatus TaxID=74068 RepID=UPI0023E2927B|nr:centrosomin-like isoform X2 [Macrosteles quadrilineatus]